MKVVDGVYEIPLAQLPNASRGDTLLNITDNRQYVCYDIVRDYPNAEIYFEWIILLEQLEPEDEFYTCDYRVASI
jgi:hypothetical protein